MPYEQIVTVPSDATNGQIPIADGSGGFSWGDQSGGGTGGTTDHTKLKNRDVADQHPIGAITGLETALAEKYSAENPPPSGTSLGIISATVGQIAKITAVDDSGAPTAWEPVDMPTGGGETWVQLAEQTLAEAAKTIAVVLVLPTTHFVAQLWTPKIEATDTPTYFNLGMNGVASNLWYYLPAKIPSNEKTAQITAEATYVGGGSWAINAYSNAGDAFGAASGYNPRAVVPIAIKSNSAEVAQSVTAEVVTNDAAQYFPAGSVLRVWGAK